MSPVVRPSAITIALLLIVSSFVPTAVRGQVVGPPQEDGGGFPMPRVGVTVVDLGSGRTGTPALEMTRMFDSPLFWRVGAAAGFTASFRGAVYGYGGLHLPIDLPGGVIARPSVSFGLYEGGTGMDLGHVVQFRSGIVVERRLSDRLLLSALLYHMSNAGLGRRNPGMEGLGIGFTYLATDGETGRLP